MVVLDDADIDSSVDAAVFGALIHQGQTRMSTERIVVDQSIAEEFVPKFAARANALSVGDPLKSNAMLGAMIDVAAAERITALVDDARSPGAEIVAGGEREGALMAATVIDRVTPQMRLYHEESFGPVTTIMRVRGVEEAIATANETEFGLSAAVFGRDISRAMEVASRIESGIRHINGPTVEASNTVRGHKGIGFGSLWRAGGHCRVHGAAPAERKAAVPVLAGCCRLAGMAQTGDVASSVSFK